MCTLFDEIAREGKAEGRAKGIIETRIDCGFSEEDILERLQKKLQVSVQTAEEYLERFGGQFLSLPRALRSRSRTWLAS